MQKTTSKAYMTVQVFKFLNLQKQNFWANVISNHLDIFILEHKERNKQTALCFERNLCTYFPRHSNIESKCQTHKNLKGSCQNFYIIKFSIKIILFILYIYL